MPFAAGSLLRCFLKYRAIVAGPLASILREQWCSPRRQSIRCKLTLRVPSIPDPEKPYASLLRPEEMLRNAVSGADAGSDTTAAIVALKKISALDQVSALQDHKRRSRHINSSPRHIPISLDRQLQSLRNAGGRLMPGDITRIPSFIHSPLSLPMLRNRRPAATRCGWFDRARRFRSIHPADRG